MKKLAVLTTAFFLTLTHSQAIIFYSTGDTSFNTTAPTGDYANSGWQYQGDWYSVSGTPIAPQFFLSAEHVGGNVGDTFIYGGTTYHTTNVYDDPNSDLRLWKVDGIFNTYAPIYTGAAEKGQELVMFGRGTQRGNEVTLAGDQKGWLWGNGDAVRRWGTNIVQDIYTSQNYGISLLGFAFDADSGNTNEGTFSGGDSGGSVFINDNGTWKIAGINSWADGPYGHETPYQDAFTASLYDTTGFYGDTLNGWEEVTGPGLVFSTRVSTSQEWIQAITGIPEPSSVILFILGISVIAFKRKNI